MPKRAARGEHQAVITGVIIHLENDLPIMADLEELPSGSDRVVRCTNVRTVDGKRPSFVHDKHSTFVFPLSVVRLIEAPAKSMQAIELPEPAERLPIDEIEVAIPEPALDEEPDESLLERIRSI